MTVTRRDFFKISGAVGAGLALSSLGVDLQPAKAYAQELKKIDKMKTAKQSTSICAYCAVGCGLLCSTDSKTNKIINIEGDPDHPINEGSLCPKGSSIYQLRDNKARLTKPLYRAAGAKEWSEVSWDWALDEIAKKVKKTRDTTFMPTSKIKVNDVEIEAVVNRTMGMASVGSAALDNEECYVYQKFLRGLGLVYIEHQARI